MTSDLEPVTIPQLRVWFAVHEENTRRSLGATFRGVAETFGWRYVSNAAQHLQKLRRKGYVDWSPNEARTLVATSRPAYLTVARNVTPIEIPNRLECIADADRWIEGLGR